MWGDGRVNELDGGTLSYCVHISTHRGVHFQNLTILHKYSQVY